MTIEQLRQVYNAQPFRAFTLHLADGRSVPVHHREFIAAAPSGRTIMVYGPDDTAIMVDLPMVVDIELDPPPRKRGRR